MNAITAILVLYLTAAVFCESCEPRPKPNFDCRTTQNTGVFFPHPADCTFLVLCLNNQPVVVSLCEDQSDKQRQSPDYTLGCPRKCAITVPNCVSRTRALTMDTVSRTLIDNPNQLTCPRSGIFVYPYDCMKAFVCPGPGVRAIVFNICENISKDSTFPVGCPSLCPGWLPGVVSQ